jgi:hypothetical protein
LPQGPRPSDKDQKAWAPLHYFVHSVAGTVIAMMNKLGTFKLQINYGVKSVSDYLFQYAISTLGCFIDTCDEDHASRYFESYQCRMVAETVLRGTFMSMAVCEKLDTAIVHAINSLTYNALHLSLVPVLQERVIQRLIQYEPLLGMATLGICMDAPVVSMQSIMQVGFPVSFLSIRACSPSCRLTFPGFLNPFFVECPCYTFPGFLNPFLLAAHERSGGHQ